MMDEDKPMSVAKAIELGFISEQILPISAKNKKMSLKHKIINALANALGVYGMTLETADGKTLELEKESGEPVVGDVVVSEDGEYIMPDGSTIVVDGGVIVEIRSGEEAAEPERGEENDTPEEGEEKSDDAEVDRLKAEIAEKDAKIDELNAEIEELRAKLDEANANAKSEDDAAVLDMVATAGGMDWLKRIQSNGKPEERATDSTSLDKLTDKKAQKMSFTEFYESRKNNKNKK
jgi:ATP-dependent Clp protease protease subunit